MLAFSKLRPGFDGLGLARVPVREPDEDEVLLRVLVAGLCGTDMQIYRDQAGYGQRMVLPRVLGHEMVGRIERIGPGVEHRQFKVGDVVSLESHLPCWKCVACATGRAHVCANTRYPGVDFDGAFAEYLTVPASIVWVNPPDIDLEHAALMEPLGIAVHASLEGSGVAAQSVAVNGREV